MVRLARRRFLEGALRSTGVLLLAACTQSAAPAAPTAAPTSGPTAGPAGPTPAPTAAAAAAAPTAAPAGTTPQQAPAPLSPPVDVKVTTLGLAPEAALYIAADKGYFQAEGLNVEIVPSSTGEQLPALATGQAHFGNTPASPQTYNAIAQGIGIKYLAPYVVVPPDDAAAAFVIAKSLIDSGRYTEYADLKGTTLGAVSWDGANRFYVERVLQRGGLTFDDITAQQLQFPDMVAALANGKIDGAWMVEPFISISEQRGVGKRLVNDGEIIAGDQPAILGMSGAFAKDHAEAAQRFMVAWLRGQRDAWHAFDQRDVVPDEAIGILINHTSIKQPQQYLSALQEHALGGYEPNATLNLQWLSDWQDYFVKIGTQKARFDINSLVDTSYAAYALQRLGRVS